MIEIEGPFGVGVGTPPLPVLTEAFFEDRDRFYSCKRHPGMDREELDVDD